MEFVFLTKVKRNWNLKKKFCEKKTLGNTGFLENMCKKYDGTVNFENFQGNSYFFYFVFLSQKKHSIIYGCFKYKSGIFEI